MANKAWLQLVGFGFRLLYNELAWLYDPVSWLVSFGQWRAWQRSILPYVEGPHILELGHGPGHLLLALADNGHPAVGLDLSTFMGRIARRRLLRAGHRPLLLRADARCLPFSPASFNTVFATFPTQYILQPDTLQAVYRLLDNGGRLLIIPEARLVRAGPLGRFIEWLYAITGQRVAPADNATATAAQLYPFAPLLATLYQAGFRSTVNYLSLPRATVTLLVAQKGDGPGIRPPFPPTWQEK